ncbi:hypothetical protein Pla144_38110 [Bythopirellula polymerisocia]|uniref:PEP-CTERM protein-sorting domain-containing protein n=2 Tax=Bythopirellula polymerisocia TaxID=2528003 RepID=A0A5C6CKI4_9BACT|nr:hypothetical protein Pla144_38110 [Bythopirellula polymerisocia]
MCTSLIALFWCSLTVAATIQFVDKVTGDFRIDKVFNVWLDEVAYTATFKHDISGQEWLMNNPDGPTITGHQDAIFAADAINSVIAEQNLSTAGGTRFTRNAFVPYVAAGPFPAAVFITLAEESPLRYELGDSSLLVQSIVKYPEWAVVSFSLENLSGDYDNDGDVDGEDFLVCQRNPSVGNLSDWQLHYGSSVSLSETRAAVPVPEPSAWILVGLVAVGSILATTSRTNRRRKICTEALRQS